MWANLQAGPEDVDVELSETTAATALPAASTTAPFNYNGAALLLRVHVGARPLDLRAWS